MYNISYKMAEELIRHLYDITYGLRQIKDTTPENVHKIFNLQLQVQGLLQQLEADGHDVSKLKAELQEELSLKYDYKTLLIRVDGGVRDVNNKQIDSKAACGFKVFGDGTLIDSKSFYLGSHMRLPLLPDEEGVQELVPINTNFAEYMALIKALDYLITCTPQVESIIIESDSETVVNQVNMLVTTRVESLLRLRNAALTRIRTLGYIDLRKISREKNAEVDALVNECLDKFAGKREYVYGKQRRETRDPKRRGSRKNETFSKRPFRRNSV